MIGVGAVLAVTGTDLVQSIISGIALGGRYSLIALAFVVVFRATGVINFATGSFVVMGAYLTYNYHNTWGVNFYLAIAMAMVSGFVLGVLLEWLVLRHLTGEAPFTVIMVTIGLLYVIDNVVTAVWGPINLTLGDPWSGNVAHLGDVVVAHRDIWAIVFTAVVLVGFLGFFRYSTMGLQMRATASDPEAARAQGISARSVYRLAWGIAGLVAALAGMIFATGTAAIQPGLGVIALSAFPAMILGGLDSPLGAVIGGIIIGVIQQLTQLLAPEYLEFAGRSVELVAPYLVMIVVLLVRPYGLFGTKEVRRV